MVTRKNNSRSFKSPLQSCVCANRAFLIGAVRVLTRVRKDERAVELTRGSLPTSHYLEGLRVQSVASVSRDDRLNRGLQQLRRHSQAIFFPNRVLNFPNMTSSR